MNLKQYNNWAKFRESTSSKISAKEVNMIAEYYADIFNKKYWKPCTCNKSRYQQWIKELNNHWSSIEKPTE